MDIKNILKEHLKGLDNPLPETRTDLRDANLCGADLHNANLRDADLCGADLHNADLHNADLRDADLCGADLCGANLCNADLCGANLCGANLCNADLCGADLCDANLCDANLRGTNLCDADLCGADLCGANLIVLITAPWTAYIQPETIRIGCQYHTTHQWKEFDDDTISQMSKGALEYWKKHKSIILAIAESLK